jgi:hypothetical protein
MESISLIASPLIHGQENLGLWGQKVNEILAIFFHFYENYLKNSVYLLPSHFLTGSLADPKKIPCSIIYHEPADGIEMSVIGHKKTQPGCCFIYNE